MKKGFIPIIFIIIGAVVISSATFGVVKYGDKITASVSSIFKKSEPEDKELKNEVNRLKEQIELLQSNQENKEEPKTIIKENKKEASSSIQQSKNTESRSQIIDEELIVAKLNYLSWLDFYKEYVVEAIINIYQDAGIPMFNHYAQTTDKLIANYNNNIKNGESSSSSTFSSFYQLAKICNDINNTLNGLSLECIQISNNIISEMNNHLKWIQDEKKNTNNYSKEQLRLNISSIRKTFDSLWDKQITDAKKIEETIEEIKNGVIDCNDKMGETLAKIENQISGLTQTNTSNYFENYKNEINSTTHLSLSNRLSQVNTQSKIINSASTMPTIVSPNRETTGWSWNTPKGKCIMSSTGHGGYSVAGVGCGHYMVSPNNMGGYIITEQ